MLIVGLHTLAYFKYLIAFDNVANSARDSLIGSISIYIYRLQFIRICSSYPKLTYPKIDQPSSLHGGARALVPPLDQRTSTYFDLRLATNAPPRRMRLAPLHSECSSESPRPDAFRLLPREGWNPVARSMRHLDAKLGSKQSMVVPTHTLSLSPSLHPTPQN